MYNATENRGDLDDLRRALEHEINVLQQQVEQLQADLRRERAARIDANTELWSALQER